MDTASMSVAEFQVYQDKYADARRAESTAQVSLARADAAVNRLLLARVPRGGDAGTELDGVDRSARAGVMMPLFDMLNHSPKTKVEWLGVAAAAAATETAGSYNVAAPQNADTVPQVCFRWEAVDGQRILPEGTEVMNNYGPKSNEELFTGYGYCFADNSNNAVAVRIGTGGGVRI